MSSLTLNFFGETVEVPFPKDIKTLRSHIADKYMFSPEDASEILIYYLKDNTKTYIINGNDFEKFINLKLTSLYLDIDQNSKLFQSNLEQVDKEKKELEALLKEVEEMKAKEKERYSLCLKEENKYRAIIDDYSHQKIQLRNGYSRYDKEKVAKHKKNEEEIYFLQKELLLPITVKIPEAEEKRLKEEKYEKERKEKEERKAKKEKEIKEKEEKFEKERNERFEQEKLKASKPIQLDSPETNAIKNNTMTAFTQVQDILNNTVSKVKTVAEKSLIDSSNLDDDAKAKLKEEKNNEIKSITRDAVAQINKLTKLVIDQSKTLIKKLNEEMENIKQEGKHEKEDETKLKAAPTKQVVHLYIQCNECKKNNITGIRYKCKECKDFNLCEECYKNKSDQHKHKNFEQITKSVYIPIQKNVERKSMKYHQRGIMHKGIQCSNCGMLPLLGFRYKCTICDNYNLCENCQDSGVSVKHNHPMVKIIYELMLKDYENMYLKMNDFTQNHEED